MGAFLKPSRSKHENIVPLEICQSLQWYKHFTQVIQTVSFFIFFFFSLGFTFNFHLSEYALIPVIELKLAMVLIHILYKKQYTLFPNICAVTKIPVHNPMGTNF